MDRIMAVLLRKLSGDRTSTIRGQTCPATFVTGIVQTGATARVVSSRRDACPKARHPAGCISWQITRPSCVPPAIAWHGARMTTRYTPGIAGASKRHRRHRQDATRTCQSHPQGAREHEDTAPPDSHRHEPQETGCRRDAVSLLDHRSARGPTKPGVSLKRRLQQPPPDGFPGAPHPSSSGRSALQRPCKRGVARASRSASPPTPFRDQTRSSANHGASARSPFCSNRVWMAPAGQGRFG